MLVTLVVRLLPDQLAAGEFVGEVESVGDGERTLVTGLPELVGFARRAAATDRLRAQEGLGKVSDHTDGKEA